MKFLQEIKNKVKNRANRYLIKQIFLDCPKYKFALREDGKTIDEYYTDSIHLFDLSQRYHYLGLDKNIFTLCFLSILKWFFPIDFQFGHIGGNFITDKINSSSLKQMKKIPLSIGGFLFLEWEPDENFDCKVYDIFPSGNVWNLSNLKDPYKYKIHMIVTCPFEEVYGLNPCSEFLHYLNEYKVIRGKTIIKKRLDMALEDSGGNELCDDHKFYRYELK